jgi:hypothetical protein
MENFTIKQNYFLILILVIPFLQYTANCYYSTSKFTENISCNTYQKKYNVKDFTMLGNTNLTLQLTGTTLTIN